MLFPVQRPGDYNAAEWELFFSFFWGGQNFNIFLQKEKKKKTGKKGFCGRPTGHNFDYPLDRKQTFFLGWPGVCIAYSFVYDVLLTTYFSVNLIRNRSCPPV